MTALADERRIEPMDLARRYAREWRLPVFPCRPDNKAPMTPNGFHDATRSESEIMAKWAVNSRAMIGIPTGEETGIIVLDVDAKPDANGFETLKALPPLPPTKTVKTPSGGRHYWFRYPAGLDLQSSNGKLGKRDGQTTGGLDIKANGGYIIAPGSRRADGVEYEDLGGELADAPPWLIAFARRDRPKERPKRELDPPFNPAPYHPSPDRSPYVDAAFRGEIDKVAHAVNGTRNSVLNSAAFAIGTLIGQGVTEAEAQAALYAAAEASGLVADDGATAALKTIRSGLEAGMMKPRDLPEPNAPRPATGHGKPSMGVPDPVCDTAFGDFAWLEGDTLPTRDWVYGRFLSRRTVSVTVAAGGTGKSSLAIVEALAMASGRALLDAQPSGRLKVAVWNLEDEYLELQRRIAAACKHHGVTREDIAGRLFVNGAEKPFLLAMQDRSGARLLEDNRASIVASLRERQIDVLIVDPFVSSHTVQENDNGAIDLVIKGWAGIAREADCAIHLIHHARKVNGAQADVESARGASSLIAAARAARVMNLMSKDEAERYGIGEDRLSHVRIDNGKSNFAPLLDAELWLKIVSIPLMNGSGFDPEGDRVGVVTQWRPPAATADLSEGDLFKCQRAIDDGGPWRENIQSPQWVGKPIAEALGLDLENKANRTKVARLIKLWIANGALQTVQLPDEKRKPRACVEVGKWAL